MHQAWERPDASQKLQEKEQAAPPVEPDQGDPLPAKDIKRLRLLYWERYRTDFPDDAATPGDRCLSKLSREVERGWSGTGHA